jgi:hypothetical protein
MSISNSKSWLSLGLAAGIVAGFTALGLGPVGLLVGGLAAVAVDLFLLRWGNHEFSAPTIRRRTVRSCKTFCA